MATDISALKKAIRLLADAANDTLKAAGDATSIGKLLEYENLMSDLLTLMPSIGEIPAEAKALQEADYAALIQELEADLALPSGKVQNVVAACLKLLTDLATVIAPDVDAILLAAKG